MAEKKIILCDTNILIELSKRNPDVTEELKSIGSSNIAVCSISAGEFIFGALNKSELQRIKKALKAIRIIHVNEEISEKALKLLESYSLSHNLNVADALIAATAIIFGLKFYTLNLKDFRFIPNLDLYNKK